VQPESPSLTVFVPSGARPEQVIKEKEDAKKIKIALSVKVVKETSK